MTTNDSKSAPVGQAETLPNPAQAPLDYARKQWDCYSRGDERSITIRAILTALKLGLREQLEDEEVTDLKWLADMGVQLSDISTYEDDRMEG